MTGKLRTVLYESLVRFADVWDAVLHPEYIILDFEFGINNSVRKAFSSSTLHFPSESVSI